MGWKVAKKLSRPVSPTLSTCEENEVLRSISSDQPAILVVEIHEARGFTVPSVNPSSEESAPGSHNRNTRVDLYSLLEYESQQDRLDLYADFHTELRWNGSSKKCTFDVTYLAKLNVSLYACKPRQNGKHDAKKRRDVLLAKYQVLPSCFHAPMGQPTPNLDQPTVINGGVNIITLDGSFDLINTTGLHGVSSHSGIIELSIKLMGEKPKLITFQDFVLQLVVGDECRSYFVGQKADTGRSYLIRRNRKKIGSPHMRQLRPRIESAFIAPLTFAFENEEYYFLASPYFGPNMTLFDRLRVEVAFPIEHARFYAAELLCALDALNKHRICDYDLQPDHVWLDYEGHLRIFDMDFYQLSRDDAYETPPETIQNTTWWTFGALLYRMLTGRILLPRRKTKHVLSPNSQNPETISDSADITIVPEEARGLLEYLLCTSFTSHASLNTVERIRSDPFFATFDWHKLLDHQYEPPTVSRIHPRDWFSPPDAGCYFEADSLSSEVLDTEGEERMQAFLAMFRGHKIG